MAHMPRTFEPTFASLRTFEAANWFKDAKFGIWSHWGPQSVPMYGDWYARNMYIEGSSQYLYHLRRYGHPSVFGYKDLAATWKAERFDPDALMALYVKAGARYFVAQATHHDHFFNYPSRLNDFNAMQVGPRKNIAGLWQAAARKVGLPFGLSEHLGASYNWWGVTKGADRQGPFQGIPYDGALHENQRIYHDSPPIELNPDTWYTHVPRYREYWLACMIELIDMFQPDLLYTDGALPFGRIQKRTEGTPPLREQDYKWGLEAVAHLYNTSIARHGENHAVYLQKDHQPDIYQVGVLDIEKSQLPGIQPVPWNTDTCIGNWFYDVRQPYKQAQHIVEMLVDIVSKNGSMLLNILQKPDGSLDDETLHLLEELADWILVCGEAIYGTRPWKTFREGETEVAIDHEHFKETAVDWRISDYRFTSKGDTVYAFLMRAPEDRVCVLRSIDQGDPIRTVRLLGGQALPFSREQGVLVVRLPERLPARYVNCLAIER